MELILYKTSSSSNEINKQLTDEISFNIRMKKRTDHLNPNIPINSEIDLMNYNYAYIPHFDRYYFIDEIIPKPNQIYNLTLKVDVIESFKEDILNSTGRIVVSENLGYANQSLETDVRRKTEKHIGDYSGVPNQENYILITLGG